AARTRSTSSGRTVVLPATTRDAVMGLTPARAATSASVVRPVARRRLRAAGARTAPPPVEEESFIQEFPNVGRNGIALSLRLTAFGHTGRHMPEPILRAPFYVRAVFFQCKR